MTEEETVFEVNENGTVYFVGTRLFIWKWVDGCWIKVDVEPEEFND